MHVRPGLKSLVPRYVHTYVQYVNCEVRMYVCTNNEELLKSYTLNNHTHLHPPQAPCTYAHHRPHPPAHTTGPTHLRTLQAPPTYTHYRTYPPTYAHYRPHPPTHTTGPTHLRTLQAPPTCAYYRPHSLTHSPSATWTLERGSHES